MFYVVDGVLSFIAGAFLFYRFVKAAGARIAKATGAIGQAAKDLKGI
jgi:hypothetical protein